MSLLVLLLQVLLWSNTTNTHLTVGRPAVSSWVAWPVPFPFPFPFPISVLNFYRAWHALYIPFLLTTYLILTGP